MIPKSSSAVRPSGSTKRLPPCRSPWNTPWTSAPSRNEMRPVRSSAFVSIPAARMPSTSSNSNPDRRSITSTRRVTRCGCGRGTIVWRTPICASACATSSMFSASRRKSSSSTIVSAKSSTSAGGFASAATGIRPTIRGPNQASARRSSRTRRATSGRCTFTTTVSPVSSVAAWTCAMDAAARGSRSKDENTASSGRPSSASTVVRTEAKDSAGTRSRRSLNSPTSSGGNSPSPPETI